MFAVSFEVLMRVLVILFLLASVWPASAETVVVVLRPGTEIVVTFVVTRHKRREPTVVVDRRAEREMGRIMSGWRPKLKW